MAIVNTTGPPADDRGRACLRGPGIPAEQAEVTAMLKTVRLTPGS